MYQWPDEAYEEMDSTLVVQQLIQQSIRRSHTNIDAILAPPDTQDEGVWKYEHLRLVAPLDAILLMSSWGKVRRTCTHTHSHIPVSVLCFISFTEGIIFI